MEPNRWIAWALDLPGCYSPALTESDAVAGAPRHIAAHFSWLKSHDSTLPASDTTLETEVVETFHSFASPERPDYIVNALFEDDRRPLSSHDVEAALRLLQWTREDLTAAIRGKTSEQLNAPLPREIGGSVAGVLKHVAGAENWYMQQMGLEARREQLGDDPLSMLETVRTNTRARLPELAGDARVVKGDGGELWSGRKVVRRALWHERAHTGHVGRLLGLPEHDRIA
jgi:hypothetical protein